MTKAVALLAAITALQNFCRGDEGGWRQIREFPAPEATQAAAADGQYIYAIANRRVAVYDRTSGARLAESTGPAEHLNSGFLHEGKLYCAHSNYPQLPEQSEIKVFDPVTLTLTTWKDFGAYGGSLTWVVHSDKHWWCNFAHYGAANHQSFLVKFDEQWNAVGRWTYPPELVRELGQHSLSGGVWQGDTLLVTGHDDPVLFRLRPPRDGNVMELIEKHPAPFTGQGIASDPQTDGLVGIDRPRRQVVFAVPPDEKTATASQPSQAPAQLRALTYNIHHGEGTDGRLDLERIAAVIRAAEPDLVALQEVDRRVERTKSIDQPAELARRTGLRVAFGGNLALQGGDYGNAVLSRYPILRQHNHHLPGPKEREPRGALEVEVHWPSAGSLSPPTPVSFISTHFDHLPDEQARVDSAQTLGVRFTASSHPAPILAGDLNAVPTSNVLAEIGRYWDKPGAATLLTSPAGRPRRQIDYVLPPAASGWRVVDARVLDEAVASDHRPLLTILEWQRPVTDASRPQAN